MSDSLHPENAVPVPGSDKTQPAAASGLLRNVVQGAHSTIDRLADGAAPAVRQLGETVAAAEQALHAKTDQLRQTRDAWVEDVRCCVRSKPLVSVLAALALGVIATRIIRGKR